MVDRKLQLKPGQTIALAGSVAEVPIESARADADQADAVMVFVLNEAELRSRFPTLQAAAGSGKMTWIAYPKAKQLGTDLNRDIIARISKENGLDPFRQIALDDVWSGLRVRVLG